MSSLRRAPGMIAWISISLILVALPVYSLASSIAKAGSQKATNTYLQFSSKNKMVMQSKVYCHRWRKVCTEKLKCAKYTYAYTGCYRCKKTAPSKYTHKLPNRVETCHFTRMRHLQRFGYSCRQYHFNRNDTFTSKEQCIKWTHGCYYVCDDR